MERVQASHPGNAGRAEAEAVASWLARADSVDRRAARVPECTSDRGCAIITALHPSGTTVDDHVPRQDADAGYARESAAEREYRAGVPAGQKHLHEELPCLSWRWPGG